MAFSSLCLFLILCLPYAHGSLQCLDSSSLQCHTVTKMGIGQCCCDGCGNITWGTACAGDLVGDTPGGACEANEILGPEPDNEGYFGDSTTVITGGICYAPGNCSLTSWEYKFQCCTCPAGYEVYAAGSATPNCDGGAECCGCTGTNEILVGSDAAGFSCSTTTTLGTVVTPTPTSTKSISTTSNPCGSETAFPTACPTSSTSCAFYICLENKYHCGASGYPLAFGYKYCEAYANSASSFSSAGQAWIQKTRLCLQKALAQDDKCMSSCSQVSSDAFGSHTMCYLQSGVCDLTLHDYYEIFVTVGAGLLLIDSFVQAVETGLACVDLKVLKFAAALAGVTLPPALQGVA